MGETLRGALLLGFGTAACFSCSLSALDGLSGGAAGGGTGGSPASDAATTPDVSMDIEPIDLTGPDDASMVVVDGAELIDDGSSRVTSVIDSGGASDDVADTAPASGCVDGCPGKGYCQGSDCVYPSCKERKASLSESPSGVYWIDPDMSGGDPPFLDYCAMNVAGGGWTLLMKVDGAKSTYAYQSSLWENTFTFQPEFPSYDVNEAKLQSYLSLPFANLLVGMRIDNTTRFAVLAIGGSSLRDLMATGYHPSALGRDGWEAISQGSLQTFCNAEGVNVATTRAWIRLGILANESNDCGTCDSFIGFGMRYQTADKFACGNFAEYSPDHGDRHTPMFGYILAR